MVETFYEALGVARGADEETIVHAFREKAKAQHPDVSDRPDASERFKRLKTAKSVLVDETERARYDSLGHESYLRERGDCCGWSIPSGDPSSTGRESVASDAARADADGGDPTPQPTPERNGTRESPQSTATAYYRPGQRIRPGATGSETGGLLSRFQTVGVWVLLDVVLLASAVATAWLILSWGSLSAVSVVVAAGLCVATLATTSLHLSIRACA